jgi:2-hydroxychromene-2-carboxylate isomerase
MTNTLLFYFDFLSPFSYLAWRRISSLDKWASAFQIEMEYCPVTMATIIHSHDTKGPAEIPSKRNYLTRQILRYAAKNGIPFTFPKELPFNSLYALRSVLTVDDVKQKERLIDQIFVAGWERGEDIGSEEVMKTIWAACDLDPEQTLESIMSSEIRKKLKMINKQAVAQKLFGVPTFVWKDELFWGADSIDDLVNVIEGKDFLNREHYQQIERDYFSS